MPRALALLLVLAALACAVPGAGGVARAAEAVAVDDGPADSWVARLLPGDDALRRGAVLALPSVYRIDVTFDVPALRTADGRLLRLDAAARRVTERGTAVAVAEGGYLVAAAHVAAPTPARLAAAAWLGREAARGRARSAAEAEAWVDRTGARPFGARTLARRARPARPAPLGSGPPPDYVAHRVRVHPGADLALLTIREPRAPFLRLRGEFSRDTPVVTIGFGGEPGLARPPRALDPAVRPGSLDGSGFAPEVLPGEVLTEVTSRVRVGDSGGPAVDADGDVRGIVLLVGAEGGGAIQRPAAVRGLLDAAGVAPGRSPAADVLFQAGVDRFWGLDFDAAAPAFNAAERAFPDHALAGPLAARAAVLARQDLRLDGTRRLQGFLLAFGVLSGAGALACALALARGAPRRRARHDAEPAAGP